MIPDIGLMIGAYIVTRMASLLTRRNSNEGVVTKVLAALTITGTVILCLDLSLRGATPPTF